MTQEFIIEGRLPSLNDLISANRTHWAKGVKLKRDAQNLILRGIAKYEVQHTDSPVRISFVWHEHTAKRDLDNIFSGKKYILDALQEAGVIDNDNQKHVRELHDEFVLDGTDYIQVIISEENNAI